MRGVEHRRVWKTPRHTTPGNNPLMSAPHFRNLTTPQLRQRITFTHNRLPLSISHPLTRYRVNIGSFLTFVPYDKVTPRALFIHRPPRSLQRQKGTQALRNPVYLKRVPHQTKTNTQHHNRPRRCASSGTKSRYWTLITFVDRHIG